jgi:hypothetical protein
MLYCCRIRDRITFQPQLQLSFVVRYFACHNLLSLGGGDAPDKVNMVKWITIHGAQII